MSRPPDPLKAVLMPLLAAALASPDPDMAVSRLRLEYLGTGRVKERTWHDWVKEARLTHKGLELPPPGADLPRAEPIDIPAIRVDTPSPLAETTKTGGNPAIPGPKVASGTGSSGNVVKFPGTKKPKPGEVPELPEGMSLEEGARIAAVMFQMMVPVPIQDLEKIPASKMFRADGNLHFQEILNQTMRDAVHLRNSAIVEAEGAFYMGCPKTFASSMKNRVAIMETAVKLMREVNSQQAFTTFIGRVLAIVYDLPPEQAEPAVEKLEAALAEAGFQLPSSADMAAMSVR